MYLHINFHKLALTQGSSYIKLSEWIAKEKAVINSKNNNKRALNGLLLQDYVKRLLKNLKAYRNYGIMQQQSQDAFYERKMVEVS